MSRASGLGGFLSGLLSGAQTVLGQLASFFRLGPYGSLPPGQEAAPSRPQLTTPAEIVQEAINRGLAPVPAGDANLSERYVCVFTDPDTGEVVTRIVTQIQYTPGTARSTRYSRARRIAQAVYDSRIPDSLLYVPRESLPFRAVARVRCQRIGRSGIQLPEQ